MTGEAPIACSLSADDLADRRRVWQRLSEQALLSQTETQAGMELRYGAGEGVEPQLRELAALEADCCSFAEWSVERRGEEVVLNVTASPDAVPAVHALFA